MYLRAYYKECTIPSVCIYYPMLCAAVLWCINRPVCPPTQALQFCLETAMSGRVEQEVREASLVVFLSWSPEQKYWNRMALSTWWSEAQLVAHFVHTILTSVAKDTVSNKMQWDSTTTTTICKHLFTFKKRLKCHGNIVIMIYSWDLYLCNTKYNYCVIFSPQRP